VGLRDLAADPSAFNGQIVRTCGQASHWSHDNNIRLQARDYKGPGVGVQWRPSTPLMVQAQYRCVTGEVRFQGCGGDGENICLHSQYDWYVVELD
jgi:hypothetical protein